MNDKMNTQMAGDLHLIASPFRFIADLFKAAAFLVIFPLVVIGAIVYAAIHGGPIMDSDTWFLVKVLFCVLLPFVMGVIVACKKRAGHGAVWLTVILFIFVSAGLATSFNWNVDAAAPSFSAATMSHTVVNGKAVMTTEGLLELRQQQVAHGLSTAAIDAELARR
jgi:cytochrome bd-type quinol oxidase subunit 2